MSLKVLHATCIASAGCIETDRCGACYASTSWFKVYSYLASPSADSECFRGFRCDERRCPTFSKHRLTEEALFHKYVIYAARGVVPRFCHLWNAVHRGCKCLSGRNPLTLVCHCRRAKGRSGWPALLRDTWFVPSPCNPWYCVVRMDEINPDGSAFQLAADKFNLQMQCKLQFNPRLGWSTNLGGSKRWVSFKLVDPMLISSCHNDKDELLNLFLLCDTLDTLCWFLF